MSLIDKLLHHDHEASETPAPEPQEEDNQDLQDAAFQDGVPVTDEELAALLKDGAYMSDEGILGPEAFAGWDNG